MSVDFQGHFSRARAYVEPLYRNSCEPMLQLVKQTRFSCFYAHTVALGYAQCVCMLVTLAFILYIHTPDLMFALLFLSGTMVLASKTGKRKEKHKANYHRLKTVKVWGEG